MPESVKTESGKKKIYDYISLLGGKGSNSYAPHLMRLFSRMAKQNIKNPATIMAVAEYRIPTSSFKGLTKSKTVMVRGKKVTKTIHLSRPSKLIEAVGDVERTILKSLEKPWDDMKKLAEDNAKGVLLKDIDDFESKMKKFTSAQNEVTGKLNTWRSIRRKIFEKFLKENRKRGATYKQSDEEDLLNWANDVRRNDNGYYESEDLNALVSLSPFFLENTLGHNVGQLSRYFTPSQWAKGGISITIERNDSDHYQLFIKCTHHVRNTDLLYHLSILTESERGTRYFGQQEESSEEDH